MPEEQLEENYKMFEGVINRYVESMPVCGHGDPLRLKMIEMIEKLSDTVLPSAALENVVVYACSSVMQLPLSLCTCTPPCVTVGWSVVGKQPFICVV